jgi:hypothetical protein
MAAHGIALEPSTLFEHEISQNRFSSLAYPSHGAAPGTIERSKAVERLEQLERTIATIDSIKLLG